MSTGIWVALLGAIVSYVGWAMVPGRLGAGILGFGLAHIVLGLIDAALNRGTIRNS